VVGKTVLELCGAMAVLEFCGADAAARWLMQPKKKMT
jgi:hypothetical protein